jgi:hypothetical protein
MAFTATKTTTGAGNWSASGTWTPAGEPGVNDEVYVIHAVTVDKDITFADLYVHGAALIWNSGWSATIKDAAGTHTGGIHIAVEATASTGFYRVDTGNHLPCVLHSQNAVPTYPIRMEATAPAGVDARVFDMEWFELRNFAPSIGHTGSILFFNTGDVTNDGILDTPVPLRRDQKIDEIYCEGRKYSRVYPEGGHAGVIELSGMVPWIGWQWQKLIDMRDTRTRISYFGQFCSLPKAFIESLRFGNRDGPYIPFSLTLVEDR